jgi:hypothetical protein
MDHGDSAIARQEANLMASLNDPKVQELLQGRHIACLASVNADGSLHLTATWFLCEVGRL